MEDILDEDEVEVPLGVGGVHADAWVGRALLESGNSFLRNIDTKVRSGLYTAGNLTITTPNVQEPDALPWRDYCIQIRKELSCSAQSRPRPRPIPPPVVPVDVVKGLLKVHR